MIRDTQIQRALSAAVRALAEAQLPDGSFALAETASRPPATPSDHLFSTAIVLGLVAAQLDAEVVARAVAYLAGRREANGLWAWMPDGSLPPDADDTACCLMAFLAAGVAVDRAASIALLRRFWRFRGPFRTWAARGMWGSRERDDPIVNCNVLRALEELGAAVRPRERSAVTRIVAQARGETRYYCSGASVAWAAASAGIPAPHLLPPAETELAGRPLECALWSLAGRLPSAASLLVPLQEADGGWHAEPWLQDHVGTWESRAVTTAFAAAALSRIAPA